MHKMLTVLLGLILGLPGTSFGQNCAGGIVYDDGSWENGYGFPPLTFPLVSYVMRFDLPPGPTVLERVCICWQRGSADSSLSFSVDIWAADGPGGAPGTLLGTLENVAASGIPFGLTGRWYEFDLTSLGLVTTASEIYVGPAWDPGDDLFFYVCGDENGSGDQPAYAGSVVPPLLPPSGELGTAEIFPNYKALGVRLEVQDDTGGCVPGDTTLCLLDGRFQVEVHWRRPSGQTGQGQTVPVTDRAGLFYFFNEDNLEMLVKMIDACSFNGHYWAFLAATTNVEFTVTVTDTETGDSNDYVNPLGMAAEPIQDTSSFATCP